MQELSAFRVHALLLTTHAALAKDEENLGARRSAAWTSTWGNLPYEVSDEELEAVFAEYGQVVSARVITDRFSGRPRGFGFVEMGNDSEAQAAIDALNGRDLKGRPLTVNQARPREAAGGRRTGGGGGGQRW